jgi:tetratricopeptide (TPR) repeat protein
MMGSMRALSIVAVCALAAPSFAQPSKADQEAADRYFAQGRELLVNKQDAKGACEAFLNAIRHDPTAPGVMLNLGLCFEMQQKYATSLYWFRKAQFAAAEAKPPLPEYEEAAKQHTQALADKVIVTRIDATGAPPDVRISVDGRPVRPEDHARLEVDRDSVIEARAPGKQPFRQQVELLDDRTAKEIVVVMKNEALGPLRDPGKRRRQIAYASFVTAGLLYGATLTYGLIVRSRYNDQNDEHYVGEDGFDDAQFDLRYKATGLFVLGTAALGAGIYLYMTAPKPYRERPQQVVTPIVSPDQLGIGLSGSF